MAIQDKQGYLDSAFVQQYLPEMVRISNKLHKKHGIDFLAYTRLKDNGKALELCTNPEWAAHRLQHYNTDKAFSPRLGLGVVHWHKLSNQTMQAMTEDARTHFDIDSIIEFVYRDNLQDCYHLYTFCTTKANADKALVFYARHRAQLLRVISDLNNKGYQHLHDESVKEAESLVHGYRYSQTQLPNTQKFKDMVAENHFYRLSDHEMEIVILYGAGGFTAKQIGNLVNKSQKTIEYHLAKIRDKTDLKDRKAMNAYAREKGWDKLVNFYSNLNNSNAQATSN